jgi:hypothetical protein
MKVLVTTRDAARALQRKLRAHVVTDGSDIVEVGPGPHTPRELCKTREAVEIIEDKDGSAVVFVPPRFAQKLAKAERDALAEPTAVKERLTRPL